MQVDWKRLDYEVFVRILPQITRLYFGQDLESERYPGDMFVLYHKGRNILAVVHRPYPTRFDELENLKQYIFKTEASAGLVVSPYPQSFGFRLFEREPGRWFPVAIWGRKQIGAIASVNSEPLAKIVPFRERAAKERGSSTFTSLGKGGVLWSDIVRFVELTCNIGEKIGLNPSNVRRHLVTRIDRCFRKAGGLTATHRRKVGEDGWFHFYRSPNERVVVQLAIDSMADVQRVATNDPLYKNHELKVVMGINKAENVEIGSGGPYDDDSIIAYYLLRERYKQYDIRATEDAVSNLVARAQRHHWLSYDTLSYFGRRRMNVYGHVSSRVRHWSAGAVTVVRKGRSFKYLVLRRQIDASWDLPIGKKKDVDDSPKQTAKREIREETGLDVDIMEGFEYVSRYSRSSGALYDDTAFVYVAETRDENVRLTDDSEHDSFAWLSLNQAIERLSFPNSRNALLKAHESLVLRSSRGASSAS